MKKTVWTISKKIAIFFFIVGMIVACYLKSPELAIATVLTCGTMITGKAISEAYSFGKSPNLYGQNYYGWDSKDKDGAEL